MAELFKVQDELPAELAELVIEHDPDVGAANDPDTASADTAEDEE